MPEPPTQEQWTLHRPTITELYMAHRMSLKLVSTHMRQKYGFQATDRMYKGRFKTWGIKKNKPRQRHRQESGLCFPQSNPDPGLRRSAANTETPENLPPTPPSSTHSPPGVQDPEERADTLRAEIGERTISILLRLFPEPPARTPTDDHIGIYKSLREKLRPEMMLRGCLINCQSLPASLEMEKNVMDVLKPLHPAAPIGILSTFNQLTDPTMIRHLASHLVECSSRVFPAADDFTHLAGAIQQLLDITTLETFRSSMAQICERLVWSVEGCLGSKSLTGFYLILLLSSKKAKETSEQDRRVRRMSMEKLRHVEVNYHDDVELALDFGLYANAYLSMVTPEQKDVFEMAHDYHRRAKDYLDDNNKNNNNADGAKRDDSNAKHYYGRACEILACCYHAQGTDRDRNEARGLLLQSVWCAVFAPGGTYANAERKMEKLKEWCRADDDAERLGELDRMRKLIRDKMTKKTDERLSDYTSRRFARPRRALRMQ